MGLALRVTNLHNAVSFLRLHNCWVDASDLPRYPEDTYERTAAIPAHDLAVAPTVVVDRLYGALGRVLSDGRAPIPTVTV